MSTIITLDNGLAASHRDVEQHEVVLDAQEEHSGEPGLGVYSTSPAKQGNKVKATSSKLP